MPQKNGLFNSSLSSRILFAVVGLILLFGGMAAFFVYIVSTQNLLSLSKKNQLHLTQDKARDIEIIIDEVFTVSKQLASEKILEDGLVASPSPVLAKQVTMLLKQYLIKDFYSAIYVMGTDGATLFSTDSRFVDQNYSFRPYFKEAMKGDIYVDVGLGITSKQLGYYFSRPLYQGEIIKGILIIKTSPLMMEKMVDYELLKLNSQTIMSDDKGVILYSSKPNRLYRSLGVLSPSDIQSEQKFKFPGKSFLPLDYEVLQTAVSSKKTFGSFEIQDKEDGEKEVLTYSQIGNYPFYFIIEAEINPYISTAASSAIIVSLFVFMAAGIAAFIISLIVRQFLSPISKLVMATEEIGKGNLNYQLPSFSTHELSALAESFRKMSFNLQDLYQNMEVKVMKRTKDLEESNKKITDSEAILKDALETSERANKLMVGRELEMLELKKIIKTLREKKYSYGANSHCPNSDKPTQTVAKRLERSCFTHFSK